MTLASISSFGRVVVVLRVVFVTLAEARAKGPPQRSDLFGLRLVVSAGEPAQVPVAQLRSFLKVRRDGFLGDLLPRDVNEEFLKGDGLGVPLAEFQQREIPGRGLAAGAAREDRRSAQPCLSPAPEYAKLDPAADRHGVQPRAAGGRRRGGGRGMRGRRRRERQLQAV